jgi:hypothetical protein
MNVITVCFIILFRCKGNKVIVASSEAKQIWVVFHGNPIKEGINFLLFVTGKNSTFDFALFSIV